jgi:hypothetical protein
MLALVLFSASALSLRRCLQRMTRRLPYQLNTAFRQIIPTISPGSAWFWLRAPPLHNKFA